MARGRSGLGAALRRRFGRRSAAAAPAEAPRTEAPAARLEALRGLGDQPSRPAAPADSAAEAELDTLRGELVRELDRIAGDDRKSFRRAS